MSEDARKAEALAWHFLIAEAEERGAARVVAAVEAEYDAECERLAPYKPEQSALLTNWLGGIKIARNAARQAAQP